MEYEGEYLYNRKYNGKGYDENEEDEKKGTKEKNMNMVNYHLKENI